MNNFGEIKPVDIRECWPDEAKDFTPWLVENINRLSEALGLEIEVIEREASVGDFALDIKARDIGSGRTIVIENQLTDTDHSHLGKLLTYAGGFDAGVLVWIAKSIRDEHRKALEWLNEQTGQEIDCFGVVVEVIKIDNSKPACNFKLVVYPNEWQKSRKGTRPSGSERNEKYRAFFQQLMDELRNKHKFTNAKIAQPQSWYFFATGLRCVNLGIRFTAKGRVSAELYIDLEDLSKTKILFDVLLAQKDNIEAKLGTSLTWERLDGKQASRIAIYREGTIEDESERLDELREWSIKHLLNLKKVLIPIAREALKQVNTRSESLTDKE